MRNKKFVRGKRKMAIGILHDAMIASLRNNSAGKGSGMQWRQNKGLIHDYNP